MKKLLLLLTFLLTTIVGFSQAGDICFLHEATAANTTGNWSDIDHPATNNNPNAIILVTHNMNSDGSLDRNDKVTSVFYNTTTNKWAVFNEDVSSLLVGSSYNIYVVGTEGKAINVVKPSGSTFWFNVDNAVLNNNANAHPIITNNWEPNHVFNNNIYGWDYQDGVGKWAIYNEIQANDIPTDAAFNVLMEPAFLSFEPNLVYTQQATVANMVNTDATQIDHPLLNDNPAARFVITHNYDAAGTTGSNMDVEKNLGVYYNSGQSKWQIVFEDATAMQVGATFNVVMPHPAPANDECSGAIAVTVNAVGTGCPTPIIANNVGATDSSPINGTPSNCSNNGFSGGDVWYSFVAPATGSVNIIIPAVGQWSSFVHAIYEGCGENTEFLCGGNYDVNQAANIPSSFIYNGLTAGDTYYLRAWDYNNNDFGDVSFCIEAIDTSGIADAVIDGFSMYPNPVNDILNIETTNPVDAVSIYNMLGQEVINTSKTQIDMSTLPAGSYVVKVQAGAQIGAYNLIKQ